MTECLLSARSCRCAGMSPTNKGGHMISSLRRRTKRAALTALAVLAACETSPNSLTSPQRPGADLTNLIDTLLDNGTPPGTVTDLAVSGIADTSATLSFTEVTDGTGQPASYDVRYSVAPISWGSASDVTRGTCTTPVQGTAIGARRTCTVLGLVASTAYQFQLVAFRGTLNMNAVFGGLSNVASATTLANATDTNPSPTPSPTPPPSSGTLPNEPAGFRMF